MNLPNAKLELDIRAYADPVPVTFNKWIIPPLEPLGNVSHDQFYTNAQDPSEWPAICAVSGCSRRGTACFARWETGDN